MKFAYLVLSHGSFELLKELLKALDAPDNDIYVHIDLKVGDVDVSPFMNVVRDSKLVFIQNRVNVKWGQISIVEATLNLMEEALRGNYDYLHLLSGVDFPIKSNDYIQQFFLEHQGKEFVGFSKENGIKAVKWRSVWQPVTRKDFKGFERIISWLSLSLIRIQKWLHLYTISPIGNIRLGSQWCSITKQLATELVAQREWILKRYKYVFAPDEMFLQTYLNEHNYLDRVYNMEDEFESCCRNIDWKRGRPYVWQDENYEELVSSKYLWARKFSEDNMSLIRRIAKIIKEK